MPIRLLLHILQKDFHPCVPNGFWNTKNGLKSYQEMLTRTWNTALKTKAEPYYNNKKPRFGRGFFI